SVSRPPVPRDLTPVIVGGTAELPAKGSICKLVTTSQWVGRRLFRPRPTEEWRYPPRMRQYDGVSAPDDQIYEKYQARAIAETNQLGHEIATWVGETHPSLTPVIGTGHPLADSFLLKYRPTAAEMQEGVAFFGRAGQAVLKSIERLRIDPLKLYGSLCLKVDVEPSDDDLERSRAWLTRELHITQPGI